jgi:CcmD family protein
MSEWKFVGAAYALTWVVLAGYTIFVHARARRARARLEHLTATREVVR